MVIQVDVEGRSDLFAKGVLHFREALGQVADVVVVHQGQGPDGREVLLASGPLDLAPGQIPQNFRAGAAPLPDELVEFRKKRGVHGDAKTHELVLHDGRTLQRRALGGQPLPLSPLAFVPSGGYSVPP